MKYFFSRELSSYFDMDCENCGDLIAEGDSLFFVNGNGYDSVKICLGCKEEMESE